MGMEIQGVSWYNPAQEGTGQPGEGSTSASSFDSKGSAEKPAKSSGAGREQLSEDEKAEVAKLQQRDREVRAHEQAHMAAGGAYVRGGASFQYQSGPDGRQYAVGGEVSIDTSAVKGNPRATIAKMQTVIRAATAPADPSGQDMSVAGAAQQAMAQAQSELGKSSGQSGGGGNNTDNNAQMIGSGKLEAPKKSFGYTDKGGQAAGSVSSLMNTFA